MSYKTSSKVRLSASTALTSATGSGGPLIKSVVICDNTYQTLDDTAVGLSGGYIRILGSGFTAGSNVYVNGVLGGTTTYVGSGELRVALSTQVGGTYSLMVFNSTGSGAIYSPGLTFSGFPTITNTSYSNNGLVINTQLFATGDGTLTYALQAGSTLPSGVTLSSTGLLSGTVTGVTQNTVYSFVILVNDAQLQTTQQTINLSVIIADQYFKNTTLLLTGEASAVPFVADLSGNNLEITSFGSTIAHVNHPYQAGYYSVNTGLFSAVNSFLVAPTSAGFNLESSSFTIEAWINIDSGTGTRAIITQDNTGSENWGIGVSGANNYLFFIGTSGTSTSATAIPYNTWTHVAAVCTGTQVKLYQNGQLTLTANNSAAPQTVSSIYIGVGTAIFSGYISNLRVVKGVAVYTGAFTPPTAPLTKTQSAGTNISAITGSQTSLLTCQDSRFKDNSNYALAITVGNGTPRVNQNQPFTKPTTWDLVGSGYFNGSTDYLLTPNTALHNFGTNDFTIELWINATTLAGAYNRVLTYSIPGISVTADDAIGIEITSGGIVSASIVGGTTRYAVNDTTAITLNTWNHFAITRVGTTLTLYRNGTSVATNTGIGVQAVPWSSNYNFYVGNWVNQRYFNGYISNLHVINGTAVAPISGGPATPVTPVANTKLLTLQTPQAQNNNQFRDSANNTLVVTRTGTLAQGTFSPYSQTGWSTYFLGTGNLSLAANTATDLSTGAPSFTIEFWMYVPSGTTNSIFLNKDGVSGSNWGSYIIQITTANTLMFLVAPNSGSSATSTAGTFVYDTWTHVAAVKAPTSISLYLNGALKQTTTLVSQMIDGGGGLQIGKNNAGAPYYATGYLSDLRIVKDIVYTGAFTPPIGPLKKSGAEYASSYSNTSNINITFSAASCSLLTLQSNRFVDNSNNALAITSSGTPQIQPISPYAPSISYTPVAVGGSMYSAGAGNWVSTPSIASLSVGTGDFTVECWAYFTAYTNATATGVFTIATAATGGGPANAIAVGLVGTAGECQVYVNGTNYSSSGAAIPQNSWVHFALVRASGVSKLYVNGIVRVSQADTASYTCTYANVGFIQGSTYCITGYLSNFRAVVGVPVYSGTSTTAANFALPSLAPLQTSGSASAACYSSTTGINTTFTSASCSCLMNFTNAGIQDFTGKNNLTTVADAKVSAVKKTGIGSLYFDGTGDWLYSNARSVNALGSGDFTIECWFNIASPSDSPIFESRSVGSATDGFLIGAFSPTVIRIFTSSALISATVANYSGLWTHVAVARVSGVTTLYVNGSAVGGTTSSLGALTNSDFAVGGGRYAGGSATINTSLNGYIDDFRITKGVARYQANFTPSSTVPPLQ